MILSAKHIRSKWLRWFAWHPVTIVDNAGFHIVWLQYVERQQFPTSRYGIPAYNSFYRRVAE